VALATADEGDDRLAARTEAVALWRELNAKDGRDAYRAGLANALKATDPVDDDSNAAAVTARTEAVALLRDLVRYYPDAHRADLADALDFLAAALLAVHERSSALRMAQEAVSHWRKLKGASLISNRTGLAMALHSLVGALAYEYETPAMLAASDESITLMRHIVEEDSSTTYRLFLATALTGSAFAQRNRAALHPHEPKYYEEALNTSQEAVELFRTLAEENPARYGPSLAAELQNRGGLLDANERAEDALACYVEAAQLYTVAAQSEPEKYAVTQAYASRRARDLWQRLNARDR
jgi:hypothetical protein